MSLTKGFCSKIDVPGKYMDGRGDGLYLLVKPSGAKSWCQRITINDRRRDLGLGSYRFFSLAEVRETAFENQKAARRGGDPLADKRALPVPTFAEAVEAVIALHGPTWKAPRAAQVWRQSLRDHASRLAGMRVDAITSGDVLAVLTPMWTTRRDMAARVKVRIGTVLKWAIAQGHRTDDPMPAVSAVLPRTGKTVEHHRALPHAELGAALERVRAVEAWPTIALAVEFCALTACRSGEVRGARWSEIDMDTLIWTMPPVRTKTGKVHRVPLSSRAVEMLEAARPYSAGDDALVFPSARNAQLNDKALRRLVDKAGLTSTMSIHGFRSSFRDWAAETGKPREVAEAALAHAAGGVEAAYYRTDLFERRVKVMKAWAQYISGSGPMVLSIRG